MKIYFQIKNDFMVGFLYHVECPLIYIIDTPPPPKKESVPVGEGGSMRVVV